MVKKVKCINSYIIKKMLGNKGIKEMSFWYFDDLIRELEKDIDIKGRYNTQFEQTVRLLKKLRQNK